MSQITVTSPIFKPHYLGTLAKIEYENSTLSPITKVEYLIDYSSTWLELSPANFQKVIISPVADKVDTYTMENILVLLDDDAEHYISFRLTNTVGVGNISIGGRGKKGTPPLPNVVSPKLLRLPYVTQYVQPFNQTNINAYSSKRPGIMEVIFSYDELLDGGNGEIPLTKISASMLLPPTSATDENLKIFTKIASANLLPEGSDENFSQFAAVDNGDLYMYIGDLFGATGPNNSYIYSGNSPEAIAAASIVGATGSSQVWIDPQSFKIVEGTKENDLIVDYGVGIGGIVRGVGKFIVAEYLLPFGGDFTSLTNPLIYFKPYNILGEGGLTRAFPNLSYTIATFAKNPNSPQVDHVVPGQNYNDYSDSFEILHDLKVYVKLPEDNGFNEPYIMYSTDTIRLEDYNEFEIITLKVLPGNTFRRNHRVKLVSRNYPEKIWFECSVESNDQFAGVLRLEILNKYVAQSSKTISVNVDRYLNDFESNKVLANIATHPLGYPYLNLYVGEQLKNNDFYKINATVTVAHKYYPDISFQAVIIGTDVSSGKLSLSVTSKTTCLVTNCKKTSMLNSVWDITVNENPQLEQLPTEISDWVIEPLYEILTIKCVVVDAATKTITDTVRTELVIEKNGFNPPTLGYFTVPGLSDIKSYEFDLRYRAGGIFNDYHLLDNWYAYPVTVYSYTPEASAQKIAFRPIVFREDYEKPTYFNLPALEPLDSITENDYNRYWSMYNYKPVVTSTNIQFRIPSEYLLGIMPGNNVVVVYKVIESQLNVGQIASSDIDFYVHPVHLDTTSTDNGKGPIITLPKTKSTYLNSEGKHVQVDYRIGIVELFRNNTANTQELLEELAKFKDKIATNITTGTIPTPGKPAPITVINKTVSETYTLLDLYYTNNFPGSIKTNVPGQNDFYVYDIEYSLNSGQSWETAVTPTDYPSFRYLDNEAYGRKYLENPGQNILNTKDDYSLTLSPGDVLVGQGIPSFTYISEVIDSNTFKTTKPIRGSATMEKVQVLGQYKSQSTSLINFSKGTSVFFIKPNLDYVKGQEIKIINTTLRGSPTFEAKRPAMIGSVHEYNASTGRISVEIKELIPSTIPTALDNLKSWEANILSNKPIYITKQVFKFSAFPRPVSTATVQGPVGNKDLTGLAIMITDLTPGQSYDIWIRVNNSHYGAGEITKIPIITQAISTYAPIANVTPIPGGFAVNLYPAQEERREADAYQYAIAEGDSLGSAPYWAILTNDKIVGLKSGTKYTLSFRSVNLFQTHGPATTPVSYFTAGPPASIPDLAFQIPTATGTDLVFPDNAVLSNIPFTIEYLIDNFTYYTMYNERVDTLDIGVTGTLENNISINLSTTTIPEEHLSKISKYFVKIRIRNDLGIGPWSSSYMLSRATKEIRPVKVKWRPGPSSIILEQISVVDIELKAQNIKCPPIMDSDKNVLRYEYLKLAKLSPPTEKTTEIASNKIIKGLEYFANKQNIWTQLTQDSVPLDDEENVVIIFRAVNDLGGLDIVDMLNNPHYKSYFYNFIEPYGYAVKNVKYGPDVDMFRGTILTKYYDVAWSEYKKRQCQECESTYTYAPYTADPNVFNNYQWGLFLKAYAHLNQQYSLNYAPAASIQSFYGCDDPTYDQQFRYNYYWADRKLGGRVNENYRKFFANTYYTAYTPIPKLDYDNAGRYVKYQENLFSPIANLLNGDYADVPGVVPFKIRSADSYLNTTNWNGKETVQQTPNYYSTKYYIYANPNQFSEEHAIPTNRGVTTPIRIRCRADAKKLEKGEFVIILGYIYDGYLLKSYRYMLARIVSNISVTSQSTVTAPEELPFVENLVSFDIINEGKLNRTKVENLVKISPFAVLPSMEAGFTSPTQGQYYRLKMYFDSVINTDTLAIEMTSSTTQWIGAFKHYFVVGMSVIVRNSGDKNLYFSAKIHRNELPSRIIVRDIATPIGSCLNSNSSQGLGCIGLPDVNAWSFDVVPQNLYSYEFTPILNSEETSPETYERFTIVSKFNKTPSSTNNNPPADASALVMDEQITGISIADKYTLNEWAQGTVESLRNNPKFKGAYTFNRKDATIIPDMLYAKDDMVLHYSYVYNYFLQTVQLVSTLYKSKFDNNDKHVSVTTHWESFVAQTPKINGDALHLPEPVLAYALQPPDPPVIVDIIEDFERIGFTIKPPFSKVYSQNTATAVDDFLSANYYDGGMHKDSPLVFRASLSEPITRSLTAEQKKIYLSGVVPISFNFKSSYNVSKITLQTAGSSTSPQIEALSTHIYAGDSISLNIPGRVQGIYVIKSILTTGSDWTIEYHDPATATQAAYEMVLPLGTNAVIYVQHVPAADLVLTPGANKSRHEINTYWLNNCKEDTEYLVSIRLDNGWIPTNRDISYTYTKTYRVRTKRKIPPPPAIDSVVYEGGKFKLKYTYGSSPVALYYNWQELSSNDYTDLDTTRRQLKNYYNIAFGLVDSSMLPDGEATIAQTKYDATTLAPRFTNSRNFFNELLTLRVDHPGYEWPTLAQIRDIQNDWPKPPYVDQAEYLNNWAQAWFTRNGIPTEDLLTIEASKLSSVKYFVPDTTYSYNVSQGRMKASNILDENGKALNFLYPLGLKNDPRGREYFKSYRKYWDKTLSTTPGKLYYDEFIKEFPYVPIAYFAREIALVKEKTTNETNLLDSPYKDTLNTLGKKPAGIPIYSSIGKTVHDDLRVRGMLYIADEYLNNNPYYESYADSIYFSVYRTPYRQKSKVSTIDTSGYDYRYTNSSIYGRNVEFGARGFYSIPAVPVEYNKQIISHPKIDGGDEETQYDLDSIYFQYYPPFVQGASKVSVRDDLLVYSNTARSFSSYTELITASFPGMCFIRKKDYDANLNNIQHSEKYVQLSSEDGSRYYSDSPLPVGIPVLPRTYDSFYPFSAEVNEEFYAVTDFAVNKFIGRNIPTYMAFVCQSQNICCVMSSGNSSSAYKDSEQSPSTAYTTLIPLEFRSDITTDTPIVSWGYPTAPGTPPNTYFGYKHSALNHDRYLWPPEDRGLTSVIAHGDEDTFPRDSSANLVRVNLVDYNCTGQQMQDNVYIDSAASKWTSTYQLNRPSSIDPLSNLIIGMPKSHMTPFELGGAYDASWSSRHTKQLNKNIAGDTASTDVKDLKLSQPTHVALDMFNNMYISDTGNKKIKKINAGTALKNNNKHASDIENLINYTSTRTITELDEFPGQIDVNYDGNIITFLAGGKLYRRINGVNYLVTTENENASNKIPAKNYQWPVYSASWGTALPEDYDRQFISSFIQTTSGSTIFLNNGRGRVVKINCLTNIDHIDCVEYSFNNVDFKKYDEFSGIPIPTSAQPGASVPMYFRTLGKNGLRSQVIQVNSDKILQVNESANILSLNADINFKTHFYTHKDGTTQRKPRHKGNVPLTTTTLPDAENVFDIVTIAQSTRNSEQNNTAFVLDEAKQRLAYVRKIIQSPIFEIITNPNYSKLLVPSEETQYFPSIATGSTSTDAAVTLVPKATGGNYNNKVRFTNVQIKTAQGFFRNEYFFNKDVAVGDIIEISDAANPGVASSTLRAKINAIEHEDQIIDSSLGPYFSVAPTVPRIPQQEAYVSFVPSLKPNNRDEFNVLPGVTATLIDDFKYIGDAGAKIFEEKFTLMLNRLRFSDPLEWTIYTSNSTDFTLDEWSLDQPTLTGKFGKVGIKLYGLDRINLAAYLYVGSWELTVRAEINVVEPVVAGTYTGTSNIVYKITVEESGYIKYGEASGNPKVRIDQYYKSSPDSIISSSTSYITLRKKTLTYPYEYEQIPLVLGNSGLSITFKSTSKDVRLISDETYYVSTNGPRLGPARVIELSEAMPAALIAAASKTAKLYTPAQTTSQLRTRLTEKLNQLKKEESLALQIIAAPQASSVIRSSDDWQYRNVTSPPQQGVSIYDLIEIDLTIKFNASRNTGITKINPTPIPYTDYTVIIKNITKNRIFEIDENAAKYKYIKQKTIDASAGVITYQVKLYNDPYATESHPRFRHWRTRPIFEDSPPPAYEYFRVAGQLKKDLYKLADWLPPNAEKSRTANSTGGGKTTACDAAFDRGWYINEYIETSGPDFSKGDVLEIYVVPDKTKYSKLADYTPYKITIPNPLLGTSTQLTGVKGEPVTY